METEVRELKDLLDEKDEKIDMLSAMHKGRRLSMSGASSVLHDTSTNCDGSRDTISDKEDTFRVQASPLLLGVENSDAYFMGASSGRTFISKLPFADMVKFYVPRLFPVAYIRFADSFFFLPDSGLEA